MPTRKRAAPAPPPAPPAKKTTRRTAASRAPAARTTRAAAAAATAVPPPARAPRRTTKRGPVEGAEAEKDTAAATRPARPRPASAKPPAKPAAKPAAATKPAASAKAPAKPAPAVATRPAATAARPKSAKAQAAPPTTPATAGTRAPPTKQATPAAPAATPKPAAATPASGRVSTRRRSTGVVVTTTAAAAGRPHPPASPPAARSPLAAAPSPVLPANTDWFDAADAAKVAAVRVALQGDPPPPPPGALPVARAAEAKALDAALARALASGRGGVAWVSGRSGTGKSLTVKALLDAPTAAWRRAPRGAPARAPPVAAVWLNCMLLQAPGDAASRLADALDAARGWGGGATTPRPCVVAADRPRSAHGGRDASETVDDALDRARRAAAALSAPRAGGGVVIVLDEADALAGGGPAAPLRGLLALAAAPSSNAVVVAVANAADAGLRLARAATADGGRDPVASIHFDAYGAAALARVLAARLAPLPGAAFHPRALRLLTARVAARGGDARTAVKAAVKALELAAEDATAVRGGADDDDGEPLSPTAAALRPAPPAAAAATTLVGMHHADAAVAASSDAWAERAVRDLPPACQFALVALLRASRRAAVAPAATAAGPVGPPATTAPAFGINRALHVSCPPCAPPKKAQQLRRAPPPGAPLDAVLAAHAKLCARLGVRAASSADFAAALASLESAGVAEVSRGAERPRLGGRYTADAGRRVVARVGMDAVRGALAGTRLLAVCLEE